MICVGILVMVHITVETGNSSYRDYVNQLVLVSEGSEIIHVMVITRKMVTAASGIIEKLVNFVDFEIILRIYPPFFYCSFCEIWLSWWGRQRRRRG